MKSLYHKYLLLRKTETKDFYIELNDLFNKLLNEQQIRVMQMYYLEKIPTKEIGKIMNLSRQRIQMIRTKALRILKQKSETNILREYL